MSLSRTWTICAVREAAGASMPSLIIKMLSEGEVVEGYSPPHPVNGGAVGPLTQKSSRAEAPRPGAYHARRHTKRHTVAEKRHTTDEKASHGGRRASHAGED